MRQNPKIRLVILALLLMFIPLIIALGNYPGGGEGIVVFCRLQVFWLEPCFTRDTR